MKAKIFLRHPDGTLHHLDHHQLVIVRNSSLDQTIAYAHTSQEKTTLNALVELRGLELRDLEEFVDSNLYGEAFYSDRVGLIEKE